MKWDEGEIYKLRLNNNIEYHLLFEPIDRICINSIKIFYKIILLWNFWERTQFLQMKFTIVKRIWTSRNVVIALHSFAFSFNLNTFCWNSRVSTHAFIWHNYKEWTKRIYKCWANAFIIRDSSKGMEHRHVNET